MQSGVFMLRMLGESCYARVMTDSFGKDGASGPAVRHLASADGWSLDEFACRAGPGDRSFEERHVAVSIAAVVEGSFTYATDTGRALLHPGALLLGNHGACYRCGHDHGAGDHCVSLQMSPEYFAEIAATAAGSSRFRFPVAMLPPGRVILSQSTVLATRAALHNPIAREEGAIALAAAVTRLCSDNAPSPVRVSALDERRVGRVLRYMDGHADQALDLGRLAAVAAMSKFHFLRVFRRSIGMTPYQYLLSLRLRRVASRLLTSPNTVSKIAFESGFGDLSTFNATFRNAFGMSPTAFRRKSIPL